MKVKKVRQRLAQGVKRQKRWTKPSIEIADIGVDCLAHVLSYSLELEDLLVVADVNEQFRQAANYVYKSRYAQKRVEIKRTEHNLLPLPKTYAVNDEQLILTDLKIILRVLRCFGRSITDISFEYKHIKNYMERFKPFYEKVIPYINLHCADSLKQIDIDPISIGFDDMCTKPFSKVETVALEVGFLDIRFLNRLFPKMQSLSLSWYWPYWHWDWFGSEVQFTIAEQYPHLQHLNFNLSKYSGAVDSFFRKTLQLNVQIRNLSVTARRSVYNQFKTIPLPNVENFCYHDYEICITNRGGVPFKLDKLRVFTLKRVNDVSQLTKYYNFIKRHPSIEKLILLYFWRDMFVDRETGFLAKLKSIKSVTLLREIILKCHIDFPIDYIMKYMMDFETLKSFSFFCSSSEDHIKNCCGNGWEVNRQSYRLWKSESEHPFITLIRNV